MPALARVRGAGGTTSALEFGTSPLRAVEGLGPHAMALTYWFDPPPGDVPLDVVVTFTGHRLDVDGSPTPGDAFVATATLADVAPGSGRTSLTHRVYGKAAGRWHVTADATAARAGEGVRLPSADGVGHSTLARIAGALAPGVVLGAWPALVVLGAVLGLVLQGLLAATHGLAAGRVLVLGLVASVLGAVGARVYYRITHRKEQRGHTLAGLSVQGFVIVSTVTFVVGGALEGMAVPHLLDATVPALLLGQAVGRLGCLLAGCCVGVPTRSRIAMWSSDRRLGTRRVPVQIMESVAAGTLALVTAVVAWRAQTAWAGALFVAGLAAYVAVRQLLFPLRDTPRATRHGRAVALGASLLALGGAAVVPLLS